MANKEINITLPKPYPAQLPVVKSCLDNKTKYITLNGGRQQGKTFLACIIAVYWALKTPGQHIMIVSPTDSQVRKIYKQIMLMIEPILDTLVKSYKSQSGDSQIVFNNKTSILFRSAASENSLRGYSNTHLLLDECAFIKEETWNTILAPTLTVRGKKVFFCSTPRGKNFFYKLYRQGLETSGLYKSFKITYQDNPFADLEFINGQKETLPEDVFAQEYLGEFTDQTGIFKGVDLNSTLIKSIKPEYGKTYVIGVDIAFKKDFTVAVCFDTQGNMIDYIRFNNVETYILQENLIQFFKKWSPRKIIIEENNQGLPIIDNLRRAGVSYIENFQTNSKTKGEIINNLMVAFNSNELKILNEEVVKEEFKAFTYYLSKSGNVQFEAAYGTDDIVMATAFTFKGLTDCRLSKVVFM